MSLPTPPDSTLSTARPPKAAIAWATRSALFCEIPSASGGPPLIVRYALTPEGLRLALNALVTNPELATRTIERKPVGSFGPKRTAEFTEAEREGVRAVLKGLKII